MTFFNLRSAFKMVVLSVFFEFFFGSAFGAPVTKKDPCPDLRGEWTCQACNDDRGPFQTGYSISQSGAGQFTDYEFPGYPEPSRYTAHSQRALEFGTAKTSCQEGRRFLIEMRSGSNKKTTQLMERVGQENILVETKEEGVNQFGNVYEKVRLEVCAVTKPAVPCPTCPFIPPTPQARGDECQQLRAQAAQLRGGSQGSSHQTNHKN